MISTSLFFLAFRAHTALLEQIKDFPNMKVQKNVRTITPNILIILSSASFTSVFFFPPIIMCCLFNYNLTVPLYLVTTLWQAQGNSMQRTGSQDKEGKMSSEQCVWEEVHSWNNKIYHVPKWLSTVKRSPWVIWENFFFL